MFPRLLQEIESNGFREVAGARASATIPLAESLLNQIVTAALPPGGAVRDVSVSPQAGNRFAVRVKMARPSFLPPVNLTITIERQPDFPRSPVLEMRLAMLPGIAALAGAALSFVDVLPAGVRLEGDRLLVDLAALAERQGQGRYVKFVKGMSVTTEAGRVIVSVDVQVD